mgnify:CR=1 FL=1
MDDVAELMTETPESPAGRRRRVSVKLDAKVAPPGPACASVTSGEAVEAAGSPIAPFRLEEGDLEELSISNLFERFGFWLALADGDGSAPEAVAAAAVTDDGPPLSGGATAPPRRPLEPATSKPGGIFAQLIDAHPYMASPGVAAQRATLHRDAKVRDSLSSAAVKVCSVSRRAVGGMLSRWNPFVQSVSRVYVGARLCRLADATSYLKSSHGWWEWHSCQAPHNKLEVAIARLLLNMAHLWCPTAAADVYIAFIDRAAEALRGVVEDLIAPAAPITATGEITPTKDFGDEGTAGDRRSRSESLGSSTNTFPVWRMRAGSGETPSLNSSTHREATEPVGLGEAPLGDSFNVPPVSGGPSPLFLRHPSRGAGTTFSPFPMPPVVRKEDILL